MKYIRTKDGIYKGGEFYLDGLDENLKPALKIKVRSTIPETEIVKQADSIEELCDEFRNITYGKNPEISEPLTYEQAKELKLKDVKINEFAPSFKTFGAIWTELGLKYVAKMNEKGELELI